MLVLAKLEFFGVVTGTSTILSPKIATITSRHLATCNVVSSVLYVTVSSMVSRSWQCRESAVASTSWTGPMCRRCWTKYLWAIASMLLCFLYKMRINCLINCIVSALTCCIILHMFALQTQHHTCTLWLLVYWPTFRLTLFFLQTVILWGYEG